ncbi:DUF4184 family protein [Chitinophaga silvatica]|uniref:DUF4184 family protein n=1 Tax=Chitinophaga silvatica TaxID=2282649 RepID=A0A3E1YAI9_9BACT|nr:DUF4184 family protein [Chitinophaga silvatica]RFS22730.1 DUF4184 family protein [Chitinophaga silvatica]
MPFTISHAAIVSPFSTTTNKYLSATGLIIGSMVPDFLYFIFLNPYFSAGHTWWGIFVYDVPVGILLAYIYHYGFKQALSYYLPFIWGKRLYQYNSFKWHQYFKSNYLVVISSIILGVFTHFFLDAFTHEKGFFVQLLPILERTSYIQGHPIQNWYLMQYLTSIIGLLVLYWYYMKIPGTQDAATASISGKIIFWGSATLISGIILLLNEYFHPIPCKGMDYLATILGGFFYGLLINILIFRKKTAIKIS